MTELPITMDQPDGWMEKTGGYAKDMTLRDYFAAKAMQGIIANSEHSHIRRDELEIYANFAYAMTDAMLKAKNAVA